MDKRHSRKTTVMVRELGEESPAWELDIWFLDLYGKVQEHTLVSPYRMHVLYNYLKLTSKLPGSILQVGVYRGGSALFIGLVKEPSRTLYLFDTFSGLPAPGPLDTPFHEGKFNDTSLSEVTNLLSEIPAVYIYPGLFPSTLSNADPEALSLVYLDVDLYDSCFSSLDAVYPLLLPGGFIIIDDYGLPGAAIEKAVSDFLQTLQKPPLVIQHVRFQAILHKPL